MLGAGLILFSTWTFGPGFTPDSVHYLACADNLLAGKGFYSFDGTPFTGWPPLTPLILAFWGLLGIDPLLVPQWLNAACMAGLVLTANSLLKNNLRSPVWVALGTLSMLMPAILMLFLYAWSEPFFCVLSLWFILVFHKYLEGGQPKWLVAAAVLAALVCLQRYLGVSLVMGGVFILLVRPGGGGFNARIKQCLAFGLVAFVPLLVWMMRNVHVASVLTGPRMPPNHTFVATCASFAESLAFLAYPGALNGMNKAAVLVAAAGGILLILKRAGNTISYSDSLAKWTFPWTLAVMTFSYLGLLFVSYLRTHLDPLPTRYVGTFFFGISILLFWTMDRATPAKSERFSSLGRTVMVIACAAWLGVGAVSLEKTLMHAHFDGVGIFSTKEWNASPMLEWLKHNPSKMENYSNLPDLVYLRTRTKCNHLPKDPENLENFALAVKDSGRIQVCWFNKSFRKYAINYRYLLNNFKVEPVALFPDGAIITLSTSKNTL